MPLNIWNLERHQAPTGSYYLIKMFQDTFTSKYVSAYVPVLTGHLIPKETLQAHISVIPKEGKDRQLCQSYCPISLQNIDLRILTKILTTILIPHITQLNHPDQAEFTPGREGRDNTQKVLNAIHYAHSNGPLIHWYWKKHLIEYTGSFSRLL